MPSLTHLAGEVTRRGFDREQEEEADRVGLKLLQAEYGHVGEAAEFLERLESRGALLAYVSTHPASAERIEEALEYAREQGWALSGPTTSWSGRGSPRKVVTEPGGGA